MIALEANLVLGRKELCSHLSLASSRTIYDKSNGQWLSEDNLKWFRNRLIDRECNFCASFCLKTVICNG